MGHAADLAQTAKAIYDIIKAGLKGGWQAAAIAALKAYWPQVLTIALILIFLPVMIVCSLPAILFGFSGSLEQTKAEQYQTYYDNYEQYRARQLETVKNQQSATCTIEYLNDPLQKGWLIALDSVNNENDLNDMTEEKLKELIKQTYTYEIADAEPREDTDDTNPWDDTAHRPPDESSEPSEPDKVIQVTTLAPDKVMDRLGFDDEHRNWAQLIYETYSGSAP
jgi:hypothetical protein